MRLIWLILLTAFFVSCSKHYNISVTIENPSEFERVDELVIIPADSLSGYDKRDNLILTVEMDSVILASQCDDLDQDGNWDELAFLVTLKPQELLKLKIKSVEPDKQPKFEVRTNIRFAKIIKIHEEYREEKYATRLKGFMTDSTKQYPQFEGPGWENDKVGFRNYFDERNGIDIFGKTTAKMILDSVGIKDDYHTLKSWGMDILKVGASLGTGSLGLMYKDTLYRVSAIEGASFTNVAEGPVRSILDLDFNEVIAGDLKLKIKHRVSIIAGEYGYRSIVTTNNKSKDLYLVTGLVNLHSNTLYFDASDKYEIMYTHDTQTENNDKLGMGIIAGINGYKGSFETPKSGEGVTNTYCLKLRTAEGEKTEFGVYAGWQLTDPMFAYRENFRNYLLKQAYKSEKPLVVTVNSKISKKL